MCQVGLSGQHGHGGPCLRGAHCLPGTQIIIPCTGPMEESWGTYEGSLCVRGTHRIGGWGLFLRKQRMGGR